MLITASGRSALRCTVADDLVKPRAWQRLQQVPLRIEDQPPVILHRIIIIAESQPPIELAGLILSCSIDRRA